MEKGRGEGAGGEAGEAGGGAGGEGGIGQRAVARRTEC